MTLGIPGSRSPTTTQCSEGALLRECGHVHSLSQARVAVLDLAGSRSQAEASSMMRRAALSATALGRSDRGPSAGTLSQSLGPYRKRPLLFRARGAFRPRLAPAPGIAQHGKAKPVA
jgi:hypothetical protein